MTTELTAIRKKLEKKLKEERYIHTLGVMYTAASMAMRHGADVQKAMTAGLLHDCGKYCDVNEQILLCRKHHIKLSDAELEVPALIHARLGFRARFVKLPNHPIICKCGCSIVNKHG